MNEPAFFDHPDLCPPTSRKQAPDTLCRLLQLYGTPEPAQERPSAWVSCFASPVAYRRAVRRLKKDGVLAYRKHQTGQRVLIIQRPPEPDPALEPARTWDSPWDGLWRVLVYDIPETERAFRTSLARYLHRQRLGCLQQSVWVTTRDFRAEYDDLLKTLDLHYVSFLFEARTVLERKADDVVSNAWNFADLAEKQRWFIDSCERNADQLRARHHDAPALETMAREELSAYQAAMRDDPLLPRSLYPRNYLGFRAHEAHRTLTSLIKDRLQQAQSCPPTGNARNRRRSTRGVRPHAPARRDPALP